MNEALCLIPIGPFTLIENTLIRVGLLSLIEVILHLVVNVALYIHFLSLSLLECFCSLFFFFFRIL